jgi:putative integral membrane protein (TIGR02587 family)
VERSEPGPWQKELDDFIRAFSGAFLFGIPLLFTMEMWWIGEFADLWKLLLFLLLAFLANIHLAYFAGFKQESTFSSSVGQAVDAMAVGVVTSIGVLLVLNQVSLAEPPDAILGKVILQAVPLSIGASVANLLLRPGENRGGEADGTPPDPWRATLNDTGATIAGALFLGFAIAPTEEIPMLAAEMSIWHELALVAVSLLLTYAIVFESGFGLQGAGTGGEGPFNRPITETVFAYLISLAVAFVLLFLFDQIEAGEPLSTMLSQTLVLGLPASIGGAAGRLVI